MNDHRPDNMTSTVLDPRRIEADYLIETSIDPRVAAEIIAGEQSSGTFRAVPRETPQLKERAAARIEKIEELLDLELEDIPNFDSIIFLNWLLGLYAHGGFYFVLWPGIPPNKQRSDRL